MKDQELVFNLRKREGECWHRSETGFETSGISFRCLICNELINRVERPDFSTPEGADWLIERLPINTTFTCSIHHNQLFVRVKFINGSIQGGHGKDFATALYQAVLRWAKERP